MSKNGSGKPYENFATGVSWTFWVRLAKAKVAAAINTRPVLLLEVEVDHQGALFPHKETTKAYRLESDA